MRAAPAVADAAIAPAAVAPSAIAPAAVAPAAVAPAADALATAGSVIGQGAYWLGNALAFLFPVTEIYKAVKTGRVETPRWRAGVLITANLALGLVNATVAGMPLWGVQNVFVRVRIASNFARPITSANSASSAGLVIKAMEPLRTCSSSA